MTRSGGGDGAQAAVPGAPVADALDGHVRSGFVRLYDQETARRLEAFDPRQAARVEGFRVELQAEAGGSAWTGVVGRAPLTGCCLEPDRAAPPKRHPNGVWQITASGDSSFYRCGDDGDSVAVDIELRLRADGAYDAACGATKVVLVGGRSIGEAWSAWEKRELDALFTAASASDPRLARSGDTWTFAQKPVGRCAILAAGCDPQRLVASCHVQGTGVVRAHGGALKVSAGNTPHSNTGACKSGALPGVKF